MSDLREPRLEGLLHHLRDNARRYCPELGAGELHLRCTGGREGPLSSVFEIEMRTPSGACALVVKLPPAPDPRHAGPGPTTSPRPRVAPLLDPRSKNRSEAVALRNIQRHFEPLGDPRFGAVRMLDFLPEQRALVMEKCEGPTLRQLLARANRLRHPRGSARLETLCANAGAWLHAYHRLPAPAHARVRNARREDFTASLHSLVGFLAPQHPAGDRLREAATRAEACAATCLPATLPLGTGHGDLAPRNVIVGPGERLTVLDTRAAWSAPIYEDIAYFLTALKTPRVQSASLGLAFPRSGLLRLEHAFLSGYFDDGPVPTVRIRLFELQALLDKWASHAERQRRGERRGVRAGYGSWSTGRLLQRSVASLVAGLALEEKEMAA